MSGQAHHQGDPEDPVHRPLPGGRLTHQHQVLAHIVEQIVTVPLLETKPVLSLSALVSGRVWSPLRSRFSGHGRTLLAVSSALGLSLQAPRDRAEQPASKADARDRTAPDHPTDRRVVPDTCPIRWSVRDAHGHSRAD